MSVWSKVELLAAQPLVYTEIRSVSERFDNVGGVPRSIFNDDRDEVVDEVN